MHSLSFIEICCQVFAGFSLPFSVEGLASETGGDLVHLLVLECFPEVVRDVEHDPLQEQHEWHPLVVSVNLLITLLISLWSNTLMRSVNTINTFILG